MYDRQTNTSAQQIANNYTSLPNSPMQSQVNQRITNVNNTLSAIRQQLEILSSRISPIILSRPVDPTGKGLAPESPLCPLACDLKDIENQVDAIHGEIANLLDSIEL